MLHHQGSYWTATQAQRYFRLLVAYQIGTFNILLVMTPTFMHPYISCHRQCKQYVLSRSSRRGDRDNTGKFIVLVSVKGRISPALRLVPAQDDKGKTVSPLVAIYSRCCKRGSMETAAPRLRVPFTQL